MFQIIIDILLIIVITFDIIWYFYNKEKLKLYQILNKDYIKLKASNEKRKARARKYYLQRKEKSNEDRLPDDI